MISRSTGDAMGELFSDEIIGKNAITSGGYPIGIIEDIVIDTETGEIKFLLVRPAAGSISTQRTDGKGHAVVTVSSMKVSGDSIIVS